MCSQLAGKRATQAGKQCDGFVGSIEWGLGPWCLGTNGDRVCMRSPTVSSSKFPIELATFLLHILAMASSLRSFELWPLGRKSGKTSPLGRKSDQTSPLGRKSGRTSAMRTCGQVDERL
jgi:hypothetical protein